MISDWFIYFGVYLDRENRYTSQEPEMCLGVMLNSEENSKIGKSFEETTNR